MQISYNWLKELIAFDLDPEALAHRLTAAGTAVKSVRPLFEFDPHLAVAEVISTAPHPDAARLKVCRIRTGQGERTVVCGAPNVKAGLRAAYMAPGGVLPDGRPIQSAPIHGVESEGMLCSEAELGLSSESAALIELGSEWAVGTALREAWGDFVLEFELTPNRPDCLSAFGIAREIGAVTGRRFHLPAIERTPEGAPVREAVTVGIADSGGCPRYSVALIENVRAGPSPRWLKERLLASGLRPINNIVDATNLVMLETGQPLHAFDYDRLQRKEVVVRASGTGEQFTTLDGQSRALPANVVLITDGSQTIALGGIMGGENSEVGPDTVRVLLESAYFDPRRTRRSRKALGIESEAALRFEKGADPNMVPYALDRAAHLMAQLSGGTVRAGMVESYPEPIVPRTLTLRPAQVGRVLGVELSAEQISGYLRLLALDVRPGREELKVRVPTFRSDLTREIDLVEEVARLYGFERIPLREQGGGRLYDRPDRETGLDEELHRHLTAAGYLEAVTNSMGPRDDYRIFRPEVEPVRIENPLSDELAFLRSTLLADLARTAEHNFNRRNLDWKLYTEGVVFVPGPDGTKPAEECRLALALAGYRQPRHWSGPAGPFDWYDLKGALIDLFGRLRLPRPAFENGPLPGLDPGASFAVRAAGVETGRAGRLGREAVRRWDLKQELWVAELSIDRLRALPVQEPAYAPLPRFPAVTRDLALVVPETVNADQLATSVRAAAGELLVHLELFDLYRGKPLPPGSKNLALSLTFRSPERSLLADEVDRIQARIVAAVAEAHQAALRA